MQRDLRLTAEKSFLAVHQQGRSWANELLVLKVIPNSLDVTRFGFSVSKRVGGAVVRNRLKRRLRECVRLRHIKSGWDSIIIVRREASSMDYHSLQKAVDSLLERAKLLEHTYPLGDKS
jgi:ribonuclease P protein component